MKSLSNNFIWSYVVVIGLVFHFIKLFNLPPPFQVVPYDRNRVVMTSALPLQEPPPSETTFLSPCTSTTFVSPMKQVPSCPQIGVSNHSTPHNTTLPNSSLQSASLKHTEASFSDYYNASYVRLLGRGQCVVAQSPNDFHHATRTGVVAFWKLIMQENIVCIVSLSRSDDHPSSSFSSYSSSPSHLRDNSNAQCNVNCDNNGGVKCRKINNTCNGDYNSHKNTTNNPPNHDDTLLSAHKMTNCCSTYWPLKMRGKALYGCVQVELIKEVQHAHYVYRQLSVSWWMCELW